MTIKIDKLSQKKLYRLTQYIFRQFMPSLEDTKNTTELIVSRDDGIICRNIHSVSQ
jgi:hypothetical protein